MKLRLLVSFLAVAILGLSLSMQTAALARRPTAHPSATPMPTPSIAPENLRATAIARREFIAWQLGVIDQKHYSADFAALLSSQKVAKTATELSSVGALQRVEWLGYFSDPDVANGQPVYLYRMVCTAGAVYAEFGFSADGKIAGVLFRDTLPTIAPKT